MTTNTGFVRNSFTEVVGEMETISKHEKNVNSLAVERVRRNDINIIVFIEKHTCIILQNMILVSYLYHGYI
jgi:hypothetical protein